MDWDKAYREHYPALYAKARQLVHNWEDAKDVVQTTFIKATRSLNENTGRCPRQLRNYLFATLRTTCIDFYRNRGREVPGFSLEEAAQLGDFLEPFEMTDGGIAEVESGIAASELLARVRRKEDRRLFETVARLGYDDAATALRCEARVVRGRVYKARGRVKEDGLEVVA